MHRNNLALPKTSIMITLNDVNNELHVRLYILEVLKDYIRDDDFDGLVDKALDFVMKAFLYLRLRPRIPP